MALPACPSIPYLPRACVRVPCAVCALQGASRRFVTSVCDNSPPFIGFRCLTTLGPAHVTVAGPGDFSPINWYLVDEVVHATVLQKLGAFPDGGCLEANSQQPL
jgi:hypothetical protein